MSSNVDGQGAPEGAPQGAPESPARDLSAWEQSGMLDRDPFAVRNAFELGDALGDPDRRGMVLDRVLRGGEQPFLPPGVTFEQARAFLHQAAAGGQQHVDPYGQQGYQQQAGYGYDPGQQYGGGFEDPAGYDQGYEPQVDPRVLQALGAQLQALQAQQQQTPQMVQQAIQQEMLRMEESRQFTEALGAAAQGLPDGARDVLAERARALRSASPHMAPGEAVKLAAGQVRGMLDAYAAGLTGGGQGGPPAPPSSSPSGGAGASGESGPIEVRSIQDAARIHRQMARGGGGLM